jgi:hypothetical protein
MKKLAWIIPLAVLTSAPAWSWCVDHDADDAKYCREHARPKCDGDADDKHSAACNKSGDTHRGKGDDTHGVGVPEPGSLSLIILGMLALLPARLRRRDS